MREDWKGEIERWYEGMKEGSRIFNKKYNRHIFFILFFGILNFSLCFCFVLGCLGRRRSSYGSKPTVPARKQELLFFFL